MILVNVVYRIISEIVMRRYVVDNFAETLSWRDYDPTLTIETHCSEK